MSNKDKHEGLYGAAKIVHQFNEEICEKGKRLPRGFLGGYTQEQRQLLAVAEALTEVLKRLAVYGQSIVEEAK